MTGSELPMMGAVLGAGKAALGEDEKTKDVLVRLAENDPAMRAAAATLAQRTAVKQQIVLKLYQPLAWLFRVRKEYFDDHFADDLAARVTHIPDEDLRTPLPSVVAPAIEGLGFSLDEPALKEMYLNLIATASDGRDPNGAHPSYAPIIRQLSADEAKFLAHLVGVPHLPIVQVHEQFHDNTYFVILLNHLIRTSNETTQQAEEEKRMPMWVDNWTRLGLVSPTYDQHIADETPDPYEWVESRPEYLRFQSDTSYEKIGFTKGILRFTDFGRHFLTAVTSAAVTKPAERTAG